MWRAFTLAAVLTMVPLAGCADLDGQDDLGPSSTGDASFERRCVDSSGVHSESGQFTYGGSASCKSGTEEYSWENPMARARVIWGGAASSGTISVTILDTAGLEVYSAEIGPNTSSSGALGTTGPGVPGPLGGPLGWTIVLEFDDFTGNLGLVLQSTT